MIDLANLLLGLALLVAAIFFPASIVAVAKEWTKVHLARLDHARTEFERRVAIERESFENHRKIEEARHQRRVGN